MLTQLMEALENLGVVRADLANGGFMRMNDQRMPSILRNYTWATKPAPDSLPTGMPIYIADIGGGSYWYTDGASWRPVSDGIVLAQWNTPFVLVGSDGATSTAGLKWTNNAGAFSLNTASAPTDPGPGNTLTNMATAGTMCLFWLPANWDNSGGAAGWRWGKFLTLNTGIIYSDTYTSGQPESQVPSSPGTLTTPNGIYLYSMDNSEIETVSGIPGMTLPAGLLNNSAEIEWMFRAFGSVNNNALQAFKVGSAYLAYENLSSTPNMERAYRIASHGSSATRQINTRSGSGMGGVSALMGTYDFTAVDFSVEKTLTVTIRLGAFNTNHYAVLGATRISGFF